MFTLWESDHVLGRVGITDRCAKKVKLLEL